MPFSSCHHSPHRLAIKMVFLIQVLAILAQNSNCLGISSIEDITYLETMKIVATIPGIDPPSVEANKPKIQALPYTQLRALRAFCRLPDIRGDNVQSVILQLEKNLVSYETVLVLEYFTGLPKANIPLSWELLNSLKDANFSTIRALGSLVGLSPPDAASILPLIEKTKTFSETGQWTAKALFEVKNLQFADVLVAIDLFASLQSRQLWAAEQLCRLNGINGTDLIQGLLGLQALTPANAMNVRAFLQSPEISPQSALQWIYGFFALSLSEKELSFPLFTTTDKEQLLAAYGKAAEEFGWEINNLHDVTDSFGAEIGESRLIGSSPATLLNLFARLHPAAQQNWARQMNRAIAENRKNEAVSILRKATAQARRETAEELTSANIYVLLACEDELYTSSFRDILVPILDNRIRNSFRGDLLDFILTVDPTNAFSSQFITNLAEKGTFTRFLPANSERQQQMIDLLTLSAFRDGYNLLLFSAAFPKILFPLSPPARTHLINRMLNSIEGDKPTFSRQIQVILQYYLERQGSSLLPQTDKTKIREMVARRGYIDLAEFLRTPFQEWTEDNTLKSLSIFQQDDDGRSSFLSNCRALLDNGYTPSLSTTFSPGQIPQDLLDELLLLFQAIKQTRDNGLIQLFRFSAKSPIVIDWKKVLNSIEITQTVAVYRSKTEQRALIVQFLKNNYEMFAQRGHSYWRRHQLFAPLNEVLSSGAISEQELLGKQRFLSLGSCGGIKAYLELNTLFHNKVDLLATVGTGSSTINNPYNRILLELVATQPGIVSWEEITNKTKNIFAATAGEEYLQPGSLPAVLYKMTYQTAIHHAPH